MEKKSASQAQQAAAAALKSAKSVHVTGTGTNSGQPVRLDLRIQGGSSTGTVELAGGRLEITRIGSDTFIKADQPGWLALGAPAAVQKRLAGQWVKLRPDQVTSLEGFTVDSLATQLAQNARPYKSTIEQSTLDGKRVVVLSKADGSKLYIANTGSAYPIRAVEKGQNPGRTDFSGYGADFHIAAPATAVDLGTLNAAELAWLAAITKVHIEIDKIFAPSDINVTRAKMLSLAAALRTCTRELVRTGVPSERLQPVYALVKKACGQYDRGAQCFATAAGVSDASGGVIVGTRAERIQTQSLDCAFAGQGDGGNTLTDAEAKGTEIKSKPPIG